MPKFFTQDVWESRFWRTQAAVGAAGARGGLDSVGGGVAGGGGVQAGGGAGGMGAGELSFIFRETGPWLIDSHPN